jgi:hypothetical protein
MKKLGIVTGVTVLGGSIIGIIATVNSQINNHRDYQDS